MLVCVSVCYCVLVLVCGCTYGCYGKGLIEQSEFDFGFVRLKLVRLIKFDFHLPIFFATWLNICHRSYGHGFESFQAYFASFQSQGTI